MEPEILVPSSSVSAIRSAESERLSSCLFADKVASLSIRAFSDNCPEEIKSKYKQTVLSAFIILDSSTSEMKVISFGVGTKFLNAFSVEKLPANIDPQVNCIRDSHAEVLAKRGVQLFLFHEIIRCLDGLESDILEFLPQLRLYQLKPSLSIHFYSSSVPCGNSSIKRWAKGKRPPTYPDLSMHEYPTEKHPRLFVTARAQGQVSPLLKLDKSLAKCSQDTFVKGEQVVPPGLAPFGSGLGRSLSCSDKIAVWNALGLQGCLLSNFMLPIYLSTCTIGRKFGKPFCERALCCRLQDFVSVGPHRSFITHHPVMLSTKVKFDEGAVVTQGDQAGAIFDDSCVAWFSGVEAAEVMDGTIGLLQPLTQTDVASESGSLQPVSGGTRGYRVSSLASSSMRQLFQAIGDRLPKADVVVGPSTESECAEGPRQSKGIAPGGLEYVMAKTSVRNALMAMSPTSVEYCLPSQSESV